MTEISRTVELADGKKLNADAGESGDEMWIWVRAEDKLNDIVKLAKVLSDPEKTARITYTVGNDVKVMEGYNDLNLVRKDNGLVSARLGKGR